MEHTLKELEDDAVRVVERKMNEKSKLEQFMVDLKNCADQYIPSDNRNFHNKWNRVKGMSTA